MVEEWIGGNNAPNPQETKIGSRMRLSPKEGEEKKHRRQSKEHIPGLSRFRGLRQENMVSAGNSCRLFSRAGEIQGMSGTGSMRLETAAGA